MYVTDVKTLYHQFEVWPCIAGVARFGTGGDLGTELDIYSIGQGGRSAGVLADIRVGGVLVC